MINRIRIRNFKKFKTLDFRLIDRAVIAGPNNSGKTTLLQGIVTWAELAEIWLERVGDFARDKEGEFRRIRLELTDFKSLALASFDEMWRHQAMHGSISIRVVHERWDVAFDVRFKGSKVVSVGPTREVSEGDLESLSECPFRALYIPSLSGLDINEPEYGEKVLFTRLAQGKGGTVVRNILKVVSQDKAKWEQLQNVIKSFFGYEISYPSGADPIAVHFRHSPDGSWNNLVNGASGFLQTVLIQSALLYGKASIILIDEPDAHLHVLLKEKMYRHIREHCENQDCQLVISTHSGRLIKEAERESGNRLFLITNTGLNAVKKQDLQTLMALDGQEIISADLKQRVLYLEGKSDLEILREWAVVLNHPVVSFLDQPFWIPTAEQRLRSFSKRHFSALKALVPNLKALEIRDKNESDAARDKQSEPDKLQTQGGRGIPSGMILIWWNRYEIENYLIHPQAISRFVQQRSGDGAAAKVNEYMQQFLPSISLRDPFVPVATDQTKGKTVIGQILDAAGVELGESEYYRIAREMSGNEINPYAIKVLDFINEYFGSE